MRIAEIKFGEVAVQVLLAAVLIDADHAALEDREETFSAVHVSIAAPDTVLVRNGP
jgi:hypothetical protein